MIEKQEWIDIFDDLYSDFLKKKGKMKMPDVRSVRFSDEAIRIIETAKGENFSDKLHNLICEYPAKEKEFDLLTERLVDRYNELRCAQQAATIARELDHYAKRLEKLLGERGAGTEQ